MKKAQIIIYNKDLISFWGLRLWKIVPVLKKVNKWPGIQVEATCNFGNFKGTKASIYLKPGEYKILE